MTFFMRWSSLGLSLKLVDGGDAVHHVHALGDFAEGGVLTVQEVPVGVHDEELAACRVHGLGPGHGEHARLGSGRSSRRWRRTHP